MANAIVDELSQQAVEHGETNGAIKRMATNYTLDSERLLGLLLKIDFNECHLVTCDAWKRKCGGVPRGAFVLFKIDPRAVSAEDRAFCDRLILARITDAVPTPVEANVQQTLFQAHKLQAQLDPLTSQDLQWGALKASIVGTFFDESFGMGFGNDVDSFFSPLAYVAFMPTNEDLTMLINSFVRCPKPLEIGRLRYTETPTLTPSINVPVLIDPRDIVGEPNQAQRLANFGKTRYGKSNSSKIIAQAVFESGIDVAQVFFDPSGEYTYPNEQDSGTCLYALYKDRSLRYSISPRSLRIDEKEMDLEPARELRINFYSNPAMGHTLIVSLWGTENPTAPQYLRPILDWAPPEDEPDHRDNVSAYNHYWRTMGMWYALLCKAGFAVPKRLIVPIDFKAPVKQELIKNVPGIAKKNEKFADKQPIEVLPEIYNTIKDLYDEHGDDEDWFGHGSDKKPYFNDIEIALLTAIAPKGLAGFRYFMPFNKYHSSEGRAVFDEIAQAVDKGTSVFIDLTLSNDQVRKNLSERICRRIFENQIRKFSSESGVGDRFVMFYFEEAHRLFEKNDSDLNSIYNLLAKEGGKYNIAMVYSTQSMTTISPDLLKNTDNFLIAHLDDDREVNEVTRKYVFRDVAEDVQRVQSKGFVRMITKSHRFALPVQIKRFASR